MSDMMGTALSALSTYQRALATTSHNIANANTEGYSRQRVTLSTRVAETSGAGAIGSGVQVTAIQRSYDQFATEQVRSGTSGLAREQTFAALATQVQSVVSDTTTGVSASLSRFFNAIQDVSTDPSSLSARRVLLSEGSALTDRFRDISSQLDGLDQDVNSRLSASVSEINGYAQRIAELNRAIADASGSMGGAAPNDLLDARDQALLGLNQLVKVSTVTQSDGALNVFIGNGQSLVLSDSAQKLALGRNSYDASQPEITTSDGGVITNFLTGGSVGGLLAFRQDVLDPMRSQVGLMAYAVASEMNAAQAEGRDLSGNAGQPFFSIPAVSVQTSSLNHGSATVSATITSLPALTGSDYRVVADGSGGFSLFTEPGGTAVNAADVGLNISLSGGAIAGDSFLVRPTAQVAGGLTVSLSAPGQIAAAGADGVFGTGDNSNALRMSAIEDSPRLFGGKVSISDGVKSMISDLATTVRSAGIAQQSQQTLLDQALARQGAVSGVNLDEEAANLMKYQQAYQAAAQIASTANTIFQTMIDAFRR